MVALRPFGLGRNALIQIVNGATDSRGHGAKSTREIKHQGTLENYYSYILIITHNPLNFS